MHNLNFIKRKHQTNLDEGLSTKQLAWNLLAVSSTAGRERRMSSQNWGRDAGVWAQQLWHPPWRAGWVLQKMLVPHEGSGSSLCRQQEAHPWPPWFSDVSSRDRWYIPHWNPVQTQRNVFVQNLWSCQTKDIKYNVKQNCCRVLTMCQALF